MKHFMIAALMLLVAIGAGAHSEENKCSTLSAEWSVPCYCGDELSNLEITLPRGLRVDAVCGLSGSQGWIDLHKEKASLDHYDEHGNMPQGYIYLSGQITLTGSISMGPNSEYPSFRTSYCNMPQAPAFLREFCDFRFDSHAVNSDTIYKKLGRPRSFHEKEMQCWSEEVTLRIIDPFVILEDSCKGGTYPGNIVVLKKTKPVFWKCEQ
ncbi:MAG: hypothetical protein FWF20_11145 [Betaproteobacteria bacterium]|nr:hypothetical protein [Betaproteobacteria bacterium]MCL2887311.1 hypothetical protein [Betaproteobacteria bacterium]